MARMTMKMVVRKRLRLLMEGYNDGEDNGETVSFISVNTSLIHDNCHQSGSSQGERQVLCQNDKKCTERDSGLCRMIGLESWCRKVPATSSNAITIVVLALPAQ